MRIFLSHPKETLTATEAKRITVEFSNHRKLTLTESPPYRGIPEGFSVCGAGNASRGERKPDACLLNITPVAGNGVIIFPCNPGNNAEREQNFTMSIFLSDLRGNRQPVKSTNIIIRLKNGKTVELLEDYAKKGLLIWGGREPLPHFSSRESENIGIFPQSANLLHLFPYKICFDSLHPGESSLS